MEATEQLPDDLERDITNGSQAMKAIIEVARKGSAVHAARQRLVSTRQGRAPDYRLSFESATSLFAEFTPARLDLPDTLRQSCCHSRRSRDTKDPQ